MQLAADLRPNRTGQAGWSGADDLEDVDRAEDADGFDALAEEEDLLALSAGTGAELSKKHARMRQRAHKKANFGMTGRANRRLQGMQGRKRRNSLHTHYDDSAAEAGDTGTGIGDGDLDGESEMDPSDLMNDAAQRDAQKYKQQMHRAEERAGRSDQENSSSNRGADEEVTPVMGASGYRKDRRGSRRQGLLVGGGVFESDQGRRGSPAGRGSLAGSQVGEEDSSGSEGEDEAVGGDGSEGVGVFRMETAQERTRRIARNNFNARDSRRFSRHFSLFKSKVGRFFPNRAIYPSLFFPLFFAIFLFLFSLFSLFFLSTLLPKLRSM
jgi:hypothetical protein